MLAVVLCRVEPLCDFLGHANLVLLLPQNLEEWMSPCLGRSRWWALSLGRGRSSLRTQTRQKFPPASKGAQLSVSGV